jgi:hypothetical protein
MFRNSLTLDELAVVLGARVLDEKEVFLSSGVVVPSPELLVTMNRDHPAKRYKATRAYLLLGGRRLAPIGVEPGPGVVGPGKILVVHQIWESGTQSWIAIEFSEPRPVGVVPVMVVESDSFLLWEKPTTSLGDSNANDLA